MKRRIFIAAVVLSLLFVFASFIPVSAAERAQIEVETNRTAVIGGEFTVDITIAENPGFAEFSFGLDYNQKYLTLVKVEAAQILEDVGAKVTYAKSITTYPYTVSVKSNENITGNGVVLFTATFKLSSSATLGTYNATCTKCSMKDKNGNTISVTARDGGVSIDCNHKYVFKEKIEPTCEAEGMTIYRCTECQKSYGSDKVPALGHKMKTISRTSPTCTEWGRVVERCSVCKYERTTDDGEPLQHDYESGAVIPSTCTDRGYTIFKCKNCGNEQYSNYTELSEHTYREDVIEEPTCYGEGYMKLTCTVCGDAHNAKMDKVDHRYSATMTKEPTHTERGWTAYACDFCGETKKGDYTDIKEYDLEYTVVTEPTCTMDGLGRWECKDGCGYFTTQILKATGHTYSNWHIEVDPTAEKSGLQTHSCKICGYEESEEIPAQDPKKPVNQEGNSGYLTPSQKVSAVLIAAIVAITVVLAVMVFLHGIRGPSRKRQRR